MPADPGSTVTGVGDPLTHCPWDFPPTPRLKTIPLPPVDPWYQNGDYTGGGDNEYCNEADVNSSEVGQITPVPPKNGQAHSLKNLKHR